jgi:ABC-2 type transport system permease protein
MNGQLWIIARREFIQRVRTKGFIISTLLGPLIMAAVIAIPVYVMVELGDEGRRSLAVVDETGVLFEELQFPESFDVMLFGDVDSARADVESGKIDGYLTIPATVLDGNGEATYASPAGGGLSLQETLRRILNGAVRSHRLRATGASPEVMQILSERTSLVMVRMAEEGDRADASAALAAIGYIMGMIIYTCMIIYGAFVMRGVIEEKVNRIAELIASSARPFHLMMGKVLGIGAVGFAQLIVWAMLGAGLMAAIGMVAAMFIDPMQYGLDSAASQEAVLDAAGFVVPELSVWTAVLFLLYFLGGFLLYASFFAAVGSAVDQESDAQQFMLPIMLPIVIPMFFTSYVVENPDAPLSVILSLIPFFSPILMTVRFAATAVPVWEVLLSLVLLAAGFLGAIWVSARIYRVGILRYGKKPSFGELARWFVSG